MVTSAMAMGRPFASVHFLAESGMNWSGEGIALTFSYGGAIAFGSESRVLRFFGKNFGLDSRFYSDNAVPLKIGWGRF